MFDVAQHLALQNVAFRNHDETAATFNQGKYLEEIKLLANKIKFYGVKEGRTALRSLSDT